MDQSLDKLLTTKIENPIPSLGRYIYPVKPLFRSCSANCTCAFVEIENSNQTAQAKKVIISVFVSAIAGIY